MGSEEVFRKKNNALCSNHVMYSGALVGNVSIMREGRSTFNILRNTPTGNRLLEVLGGNGRTILVLEWILNK